MKQAIGVILALTLASCSGNHSIVVGSKNFTEQVILGEIAAQQIERKLHVKVDRRLNLGGTLLAHQSIRKGYIDIYPEYTGTASSVVLKRSAARDPAKAYVDVKEQYLKLFQLVVFPPLGFDDTFAMVVRSEDARKLRKPSISEASSRAWRLGVGYEFLTRRDGLESLNKTYGLRWEGTPRSMDLGLLYQALRQKKVDMAAANSTDAALTSSEFTVLADDKHAFPPYNACYIVRKELAEEQPAVGLALTMLSNHLNAQTMRALNRRVDVEHRAVEQVAREYLTSQE